MRVPDGRQGALIANPSWMLRILETKSPWLRVSNEPASRASNSRRRSSMGSQSLRSSEFALFVGEFKVFHAYTLQNTIIRRHVQSRLFVIPKLSLVEKSVLASMSIIETIENLTTLI